MEKIAFAVIGASAAVVVMTLIPLFTHDMTKPVDGMVMSETVMTDQEMSGMMMEDMCSANISDMAAMHQHPLRSVSPNLPVPTVSHLVFPDAMDGYNIQILTKNYEFTPAAINREAVDNEGHAHIYVNGTKISRVYSNWFHLPSSYLQPGDNLITVTLNANDHSEWAIGDTQIASTVRVVRSSVSQ
ncbi:MULTISPECIES: hypothetical protein [Pacificibacter]|uniref:hypothetical protein n=1 Tax=Pacificibacter TaxID=1042323 RepID=UPI001C08101B|nr:MULTISPECIES: hypothetical protein [Pacificibacter]MBU2936505.1 hypothetical protein [Pacificibacter marinus]MDO6614693.1 hypothetical protein [Pacificibacter sp. 1_MG-2023]